MRVNSASIPVIITTALLLSACNQKPNPPTTNSAPVVEAKHVRLQKVMTWDSFNGRVSAVETVAILPRVDGYITQVGYREGSEVKKGDLLFVIDQRPYRSALDSARAQLERARAALAFADQQDGRAQQLLKSNAVSREEAEQKHTAHELGLAEVHAAEAAVANATLNLQFTEVRAPIDGRTSRAQLTLGNLAVANQSVLTSLVSQNPVHVDFDPDEHSYLNYQQALKNSGKASVRIGLANSEDFPYQGELSFIDNQVNASTGTVHARATVNNADRLLIPGLYARVQLSVGEPAVAMLIPDRAILTDQDKHYVYVLGKDNTAEKRYVKTGNLIDRQRVITADLEPDDSVIVSGLQNIHASGTTVIPHVMPADKSELNIPSFAPSAK
ncbi:efflux RND transporter periplasmic adaptor subunit [Pseudomonas tolaasii]|uniref:Efflux RND transporter periplasmic adaptor subunit n=2 Tax=Pseudomonas tolaasii TaxID=29442 RepID=A0A7Y8ARJ6_PSETO|nr:efflux RND transporter periplasmic adaptor subunit [Pseudomonas tolaasii]ARB26686.1 MexE family multidrug efflux RND transporter periplasmic adaptor subunit [Pseudomonas tolaasii]KAB0470577.1 efflux RND transporter periplasmic adaptor subunit [Pseudomonas tolaasii]MBY8944059.1 efflux RND transporter periplasmic adaptor subunit [Pseudomonas tolaasii]NVZ45382.1 efflux RND transporter periplasmic adaptor subunit [Pseudomonas tolaasii]NWA48638.1 efflux RND transporter periplasmic adaptor subuni